MKKIFISMILIVSVLYSINIAAQTTVEQDLKNLKKYWYYHYRLVNDFMAKGDCQGCSEPMNERGFKPKNDQSTTPSTTAKWGDQTIAIGNGYAGVKIAPAEGVIIKGNVGIGTDLASNVDNYKLAVKGNIRANKVVCNIGWSDFVFEKKL